MVLSEAGAVISEAEAPVSEVETLVTEAGIMVSGAGALVARVGVVRRFVKRGALFTGIGESPPPGERNGELRPAMASERRGRCRVSIAEMVTT